MGQQQHTSTLSVDCDARRIAAECLNVLLDPAQGFELVEDANVQVPRRGIREFRRGEEAQSSQAVVDRHDDNIWALLYPMIEGKADRVAVSIAATVDVG